jgi:hypothetical protein
LIKRPDEELSGVQVFHNGQSDVKPPGSVHPSIGHRQIYLPANKPVTLGFGTGDEFAVGVDPKPRLSQLSE